ncbi:flagellar basal body L-ring protein FlgH [Sphingomonas sp. 1P06PA]|uniref:flagellar basal body L-ring protein FlgH n=1 Tax=Sphingomonas sp. 1P06PA TaxID=554121 RepID=UPI0039A6AAFE
MRVLALLAAAALVASPVHALPFLKKKGPSEFAPTLAEPTPPPVRANGAIFQAANGYAPLTSGARAAMVGDILTIALVERTLAVKSATQTSGREGEIGLSPPVTGPLGFFSSSDINAGGNSSFTGRGQATQSNTLQGEITVTVAQVYPNGTMLVKGEKMVRLNRGDEQIRFAGLVRAVDIAADNRVASTRVADARITYTGTGEVARASKQGWLQRFFNVISPF